MSNIDVTILVRSIATVQTSIHDSSSNDDKLNIIVENVFSTVNHRETKATKGYKRLQKANKSIDVSNLYGDYAVLVNPSPDISEHTPVTNKL